MGILHTIRSTFVYRYKVCEQFEMRGISVQWRDVIGVLSSRQQNKIKVKITVFYQDFGGIPHYNINI